MRRTVRELPLQDLAPDALRAGLDRYGVVCVRNAHLDDRRFTALMAGLGDFMFTSGETAVDGFSHLNVVTNAGRATPPRSRFHTDSSYYRRPPSYTALRPVAVPEAGGATLFIDMCEALAALEPVRRDALRGRRARHVVSGVTPEAGAETESWQPLLRRTPGGREALYLSVPERLEEIEGESRARTREIVDALYGFATSQPHIRHDWRAGDFLIWDNRTTLHKGDHSAVVGERTLHRAMVRGEVPELA